MESIKFQFNTSKAKTFSVDSKSPDNVSGALTWRMSCRECDSTTRYSLASSKLFLMLEVSTVILENKMLASLETSLNSRLW